MPDTDQPRTIRFGAFELDLRAGELRKNGARIKLQEQPFRILVVLVRHPGDVVTREELRRELWPADTFVDFEHSLNAAIKRLRDALGESAENPVFIETLAKRGYRFNARVDKQVAASVEAPSPPSPASRIPRRHKVLRLASVAVAIAAGLTALIWAGYSRWGVNARENSIKSLAVLPLENLSGDPEQQYFSDGMTDALISQLSKTGALRVISRTTAMRYKGTKKSVPEIAQELNVDALIEGTVLRSRERVRIVIQLIQARRDQHVWTESYERDLGDVLRLQSDVAQAVAQQVRLQLTTAEQARLRAARPVDPQAYEAYLKGRFHRPAGTQLAIKRAQAYFEEAVQKDPTFALAYVGLAQCYLDLGTYRWMPPQEAYRRGSEAIHKALQFDESISEAHSTLGYQEWQYTWDWAAAEKELRYAIELKPNDIESHESLLWFLAWSGRRDEAMAEVEEMRRLDPVYPYIPLEEAGVYYHQRNYKSLVEAGQKSVATYPNAWSSHYFLAVGYEGSGQLAEAVTEYQQAVALSERDSDTTAGLAHAYAAMGRFAEAQRILDELRRQATVSYASPYMIAAIYSGLGEKDKAFEFLERAYQERTPDLAYFLKADLRVDTLRSDPRFQSLSRRVGLP